MPLLDPTLPSDATDAERAAAALLADLASTHAVIWRRLQATFHRVWTHPSVAPADLLAALGTRAGPLFACSAALNAVLVQAKSDTPTLVPPVALTFHPDGTVTVDEPPAP